MKRFKKIAAGTLMTLGLLCLVGSAGEWIEARTPEGKMDAVLAGLGLGIPAMASGGWLMWGMYRDRQKEMRDRLHSIFYDLLQANNGRLTVLRFAMEAQLPAETAKKYLDENARQFNANFEPLDNGDIAYQFNL